ncbi:MAG: hypothetical protein ACRCZF_15765 [Gemmataceae bacterium]
MRMNRALFLLLLVPLTVLGQGKDKPAPKAGQPLSGKEIAEIWKARQERIKSVKMTWTEKHIYERGGHPVTRLLPMQREIVLRKNNPEEIAALPPVGSRLPENRYEQSTTSQLVTQAESVYLLSHSIQYDFKNKKFYPNKEESSWNGKQLRTLAENHKKQNAGIRNKDQIAVHFNNATTFVLFHSLLVSHPKLGIIDPQLFIPTGNQEKFGGKLCDEYKCTGKQNEKTRYLLCPTLDYQIVYIGTIAKPPGHVGDWRQQSTSVGYSDTEHGPLPSDWEHIAFLNGKIESEIQCKRTSLELNKTLPESLFKINFEPGMTLTHESKNAFANGVIQEDGSFLVKESNNIETLYRETTRSKWRYAFYCLFAGTATILILWLVRKQRTTTT